MELPLKISKEMDAKDESRIMRMPREFREFAEWDVGDLVTAREKDGHATYFYVERAYAEDVAIDPMSVFVTTDNFNRIMTKTSKVCNVDAVEGITLGCDPELMVIDRQSGHLVSAQSFFGLNKYGQVGYDGLLLELRPNPSVSEVEVVNNIYDLLVQARTNFLGKCPMFPNLMLAGISSFAGKAAVARNIAQNTAIFQNNTILTAGFHLHYGIPKEILGYQKKFVAQQVVKALDFYVGIPSIVPEGSTDSYRRTVQGVEYGKPGMFRIDHRTLEYRTPGAALMKHPILAQGLLGLGAVVIEDIISRVKTKTSNFTKLNEMANDADIRVLYPNIPPVMEIFRSICSPTADVAKGYLDTIRRDLEEMVGFKRRAETVNNFFNNIETSFSMDVEDNWWRYRNHGERQSG
jgi:hypothetical protein